MIHPAMAVRKVNYTIGKRKKMCDRHTVIGDYNTYWLLTSTEMNLTVHGGSALC